MIRVNSKIFISGMLIFILAMPPAYSYDFDRRMASSPEALMPVMPPESQNSPAMEESQHESTAEMQLNDSSFLAPPDEPNGENAEDSLPAPSPQPSEQAILTDAPVEVISVETPGTSESVSQEQPANTNTVDANTIIAPPLMTGPGGIIPILIEIILGGGDANSVAAARNGTLDPELAEQERRQKQAEEVQRKAEEIARRQTEEAHARQAAEEMARRQAEEAQRKAEEIAKRQTEEAHARQAAEEMAKRQAEEAQRKADEEAKKKQTEIEKNLEEIFKAAEEAARKRREELAAVDQEAYKRGQEEAEKIIEEIHRKADMEALEYEKQRAEEFKRQQQAAEELSARMDRETQKAAQVQVASAALAPQPSQQPSLVVATERGSVVQEPVEVKTRTPSSYWAQSEPNDQGNSERKKSKKKAGNRKS